MFSIREATETDNSILYEKTLELLKFHLGSSENSQLTEKGLLKLQNENIMKILVLLSREGMHQDGVFNKEKLIGYTIFIPEFDMLFSSHGILLDHFFIQENFRGMGQGRKLLKAVCSAAKLNSAKYIKLYFQKGHDLDQFYSHFGFKNLTYSEPNLHLFEVYGLEEITRCLKLDLTGVHFKDRIQNLLKKRIFEYNGIEAWSTSLEKSNSKKNFNILLTIALPKCANSRTIDGPPNGKLVVIVRISSRNETEAAIQTLKDFLQKVNLSFQSDATEIWGRIDSLNRFAVESRDETSFCAFIEKPSICGWLGKMVTFANFVGDVSIFNQEIITDRLVYWASIWHLLKGVNFEVPIHNTHNSKYQPLLTLMSQLEIEDGSAEDGWNVAVLDEKHIDKIISE